MAVNQADRSPWPLGASSFVQEDDKGTSCSFGDLFLLPPGQAAGSGRPPLPSPAEQVGLHFSEIGLRSFRHPSGVLFSLGGYHPHSSGSPQGAGTRSV